MLPFFRSRLWTAYAIRRLRAPRAIVVVSPMAPAFYTLAEGRSLDERSVDNTVLTAVVYVYRVMRAGVGAIRPSAS